ncbi:MAG: hypothetical protein H6823_08895 [Planctomycetaceae bacterium]|nr:hypothetical protein [Planctomycetaceae bacterium]
MMLVVSELGIDEPAEVVSIWPCPSIPAGEGRIVLGTFTHVAPENGLHVPRRFGRAHPLHAQSHYLVRRTSGFC